MNAVVLLSALVLIGQASARLQWQRLPTATGADRLRVRTAYAIAMEGTQYPYLFNDGNILGAGYYAYARSGASLGGKTFGAYYDKNLAPITTSTTPITPAVNTKSNYPAYSSLLNFGNTTTINVQYYNVTDISPAQDGSNLTVVGPLTKTIPAGVIYSVTSFEKGLPSPVYLTTLTQESENGTLTATATTPVPTANVFGILSAAGGDTTDKQTTLGTESTILDAKIYTAAYVAGAAKAKDPIVSMVKATTAAFNVYNYGYVWEASVTPAAVASASIVKHFVMGRIGATTVHVMPDQKTVYMANSGTGQAIFMFVANTAGDFSAGCLYALKVGTQTGTGAQAPNGAYVAGGLVSFANPTWVQLGCSTDAAVDALRSSTFAAIFKVAAVPASKTCVAPARLVRNDATFKPECATLLGTVTQAAFLEPRRYAAYLGATVDWNTVNGFAFDSARKLLYVSIGQVTNSMLTVTTDLALNHITMIQNSCGMIFSMSLGSAAGVTGSTFATTAINTLLGAGPITTTDINGGSNTVQNRIGGFVNAAFVTTGNTYIKKVGTSYTITATTQPAYNSTNDINVNFNNVCDIGNIANPKDISYVAGHDQLVISEDTSFGHQNDMLWVMDLNYATEIVNYVPPAAQYNYNPSQLTRIATAPFGSEWTSVNWIPNINGFAYLSATIQHPFTEDSASRINNVTASATPAYEAYVGYIGWNLAYLYYLEVGQVGGFFSYGTLCAQGTAPNDEACDDGNVLTQDTCVNDGVEYFWTCQNTPIPAKPCTAGNGANVCNDGDPCSFNACVFSQGQEPVGSQIGNCQTTPGNPSCVPCNSTSPCNDDNVCTVDVCTDGSFDPITGDPRIKTSGICAFIQPYGAESNSSLCTSCTTAAQCNDANTCTLDQCSTGLSNPPAGLAGVCTSIFPAGISTSATNCTTCTNVATCNDLDDCTFDDCVVPDQFGNFVSVTGGKTGICVSTPVDGCEACNTTATCTNLTDLYPYDPTFPVGFLNVTFPNLPNYAATPYCLTAQCYNKRCQPNTDLTLGASCRCGGFNATTGGNIAACPAAPLCKVISGCVPFSNTCTYANSPNGVGCGAGKSCLNGSCV